MTANTIATSLTDALVADLTADAIELIDRMGGWESLRPVRRLLRDGDLVGALAIFNDYGYGCLQVAREQIQKAIEIQNG